MTAADAQRIQRSLSIPYERFLTLYPQDYFDPPLEEDDSRLATTRDGRFALGLARVEDECFFLKGNLCSIHLVKPMVCRLYPFQPVELEEPQGPFQVAPDSCWGLNAWDGAPDETEVRSAYARYSQEESEYQEVLERWNGDPAAAQRTREELLTYLGLITSVTPVGSERR